MKGMQFEDVGHTFVCEPASSPATPGTLWWWVTISGESQRYAAFRVEPNDTPASLRPRVLAVSVPAMGASSMSVTAIVNSLEKLSPSLSVEVIRML